MDAFERRVFENKGRPEIDVDYDSTSDSNTYESYGLTDNKLQMFKKLFGYETPIKLMQALIEATDEEYNDLLKNLNIKLTVFRYYTKTKIGVSCTRLENLTNFLEYILVSVRWRHNITDLESEKTAAQRRNESSSGERIKIHLVKCLIDYQFL